MICTFKCPFLLNFVNIPKISGSFKANRTADHTDYTDRKIGWQDHRIDLNDYASKLILWMKHVELVQ